jgi:uncharacterized protein YndB with AHSA1/START domain
VTSLTIVRKIAARPSVVFEALTTPQGIVQWWGPDDGPVLVAETDVRVGGRFRVRFRMLDATEHEASGEYLELNPPERIAMSWRWLGGEDEDTANESVLSFDLRSHDEGTELTLTHARLASSETRASHESGWSGSLDKLQRVFSKEDRHEQA